MNAFAEKIAAILRLAAVGTLLLALCEPASAGTVADFYRGKTISLYVGFPPGGGYDIYARVLAKHWGGHIPGHPTVLIKNMPGGSGVRAAAYIAHATPQDGRSLGMFLDLTTLGKVLGGPGEFDPVKMVWIGRVNSTASVAMVWHTAPAQTVEEAKHTPITMAVTQPGTSTSMISAALNDLVGTKFKIVRGYQGSAAMAMAMERGEVDAMGGMSWEAVRNTKQEWLAKHKAKVLYGFGIRRLAEVPDAPSLPELAIDKRSRQLLSLLGKASEIGRSIAAEPGIPPERAAALRTSFMETIKDPAFLADMARGRLDVDPLKGEEVQKLVVETAETPPELIDQAKRYAK